jgi:hypothetical protein
MVWRSAVLLCVVVLAPPVTAFAPAVIRRAPAARRSSRAFMCDSPAEASAAEESPASAPLEMTIEEKNQQALMSPAGGLADIIASGVAKYGAYALGGLVAFVVVVRLFEMVTELVGGAA